MTMEIDEGLAFVTEHHRAVMATYRDDGSPQLSPVTVGVDDDGFVVMSTRETAVKVRNLTADPRTSLCVFTDAFFGPWVRIDGTASVVSLPDAMDGLIDYYRRISGEHDDWDDYRAAMERERRVLVRIAVTAVGPDISG
jgi:PPOX class probable F420-dependent enzyme